MPPRTPTSQPPPDIPGILPRGGLRPGRSDIRSPSAVPGPITTGQPDFIVPTAPGAVTPPPAPHVNYPPIPNAPKPLTPEQQADFDQFLKARTAKTTPRENWITAGARGFGEAFGGEPLGPSPETMEQFRKSGYSPGGMFDPEIRAAGTVGDFVNRALAGLNNAAATAAGSIVGDVTGSKTQAGQAERATRAAAEILPAVGWPEFPEGGLKTRPSTVSPETGWLKGGISDPHEGEILPPEPKPPSGPGLPPKGPTIIEGVHEREPPAGPSGFGGPLPGPGPTSGPTPGPTTPPGGPSKVRPPAPPPVLSPHAEVEKIARDAVSKAAEREVTKQGRAPAPTVPGDRPPGEGATTPGPPLHPHSGVYFDKPPGDPTDALPPVAPGSIRVYGRGEGNWVHTDPKQAPGQGPLHYADVPADAPEVVGARNWEEGKEHEYGPAVGTHTHFELSDEQAKGFKPVSGEAPTGEAPKAPTDAPPAVVKYVDDLIQRRGTQSLQVIDGLMRDPKLTPRVKDFLQRARQLVEERQGKPLEGDVLPPETKPGLHHWQLADDYIKEHGDDVIKELDSKLQSPYLKDKTKADLRIVREIVLHKQRSAKAMKDLKAAEEERARKLAEGKPPLEGEVLPPEKPGEATPEEQPSLLKEARISKEELEQRRAGTNWHELETRRRAIMDELMPPGGYKGSKKNWDAKIKELDEINARQDEIDNRQVEGKAEPSKSAAQAEQEAKKAEEVKQEAEAQRRADALIQQFGHDDTIKGLNRLLKDPNLDPEVAKMIRRMQEIVRERQTAGPKPGDEYQIGGAHDIGKINEYATAIIKNLAERFGIDPDRIKIKLLNPTNLSHFGHVEVYPFGGDINILWNKDLPAEQALAVMFHEFGHALQWEVFDNLPDADKRAVTDAYARFVQAQQGRTLTQILQDRKSPVESGLMFKKIDEEIALRKAADPTYVSDMDIPIGKVKPGRIAYHKGFEEWFADQVSGWLTTNKKPVGLVEKFFKGIANMWRALYKRATGRFAVAKEIDDFMRRHGKWDDLDQAKRTLKSDDTAGERPRTAESRGSDPPPPKDWILKHWDELHKHDRTGDFDKIEMLKWVRSIPRNVLAMRDRLWRYVEPGAKPRLNADERRAFVTHLMPKLQEVRHIYERIRNIAPGIFPHDFDPNYISHMVKDRTPEFDVPLGADIPEGHHPWMSKLPRTTGALQSSRYYVLEHPGTGAREVVMRDDRGNWHRMSGRTPTLIPAHELEHMTPGEEVVPGSDVKYRGQPGWKIGRASAAEKEAETNYQYYKDPFAAVAATIVKLRKVERSIKWFDDITHSAEWLNFARKRGGNQEIPAGWRESKLEIARDWMLHPHLADLLDQYAGKFGIFSDTIEEGLAKFNQGILKFLFLQPFRHAANLIPHWAIAGGWDWINPLQWKNFAVNLEKAIRDVSQQGPITQDLLKHGSSQMLPRHLNREFHTNVLKALGNNVKKTPWYKDILKTLGISSTEFDGMWGKAASHALWWFNDVLMTHMVLQFKSKGLTTEQAIKAAEKHIPNYRVEPRTFGSSLLSRYFSSSAFTSFGRFHQNIWRGYAHIARDLAKGSMKDKLDAMGNVMVMGVLGMVVIPAISAGIAQLTGNKRDKAPAWGPFGVLEDIGDLAKDALHQVAPLTMTKLGMTPPERTFTQIVQNALSLSPTLEQLITQLGHQPYTGQPIQTFGEHLGALADMVLPFEILHDLWSKRKTPIEEGLSLTTGLRQEPKRPTLKQRITEQNRERATARHSPVDHFVTEFFDTLHKFERQLYRGAPGP